MKGRESCFSTKHFATNQRTTNDVRRRIKAKPRRVLLLVAVALEAMWAFMLQRDTRSQGACPMALVRGRAFRLPARQSSLNCHTTAVDRLVGRSPLSVRYVHISSTSEIVPFPEELSFFLFLFNTCTLHPETPRFWIYASRSSCLQDKQEGRSPPILSGIPAICLKNNPPGGRGSKKPPT